MTSSDINPTIASTLRNNPSPGLSTLTEMDFIDAFGITALVGYEADSNRAIGLCTATRDDYHFHLALAKMDTLIYRTRSKHRLMHTCIKGNAKWFKMLWSAGSENDMINLFKPFRDRHGSHYHHRHHHHQNQPSYQYESWSRGIHEAGNLLNLLVDNVDDSKNTDNTVKIEEDTLNRLSILRILLATNIDINHGEPLSRVIQKENVKLAKEFFNYPDRLDLSSDSWDSPIRIATNKNFADIVGLICALPTANIGTTSADDEYSDTPLKLAVSEGYTAIVNILLRYPDRISINHGASSYRGNALHMAIYRKRKDTISLLLACPSIDINARHSKYGSPLTMALRRVDMDTVRALLRMTDRLNVNITNRYNETALSLACRKGSLKIVRSLITFPNIDMNTVDNNRLTPLHHAVQNEHLSIVKTLVKNPTKCNVNLQDSRNRTALHMAVETKNLDLVRTLVAVPTIDLTLAETDNGYTPLHLAITQSSLDNWHIANVLLRYTQPENINAQDNEGNTCLHLASFRHLVPIMEKICTYPTLDSKVTNHRGLNAGMIAKQCHFNVMNILRSRGADTIMFGRFGRSHDETGSNVREEGISTTDDATNTSSTDTITTTTTTSNAGNTNTTTVSPLMPTSGYNRAAILSLFHRSSMGSTTSTTSTTATDPSSSSPDVTVTLASLLNRLNITSTDNAGSSDSSSSSSTQSSTPKNN